MIFSRDGKRSMHYMALFLNVNAFLKSYSGEKASREEINDMSNVISYLNSIRKKGDRKNFNDFCRIFLLKRPSLFYPKARKDFDRHLERRISDYIIGLASAAGGKVEKRAIQDILSDFRTIYRWYDTRYTRYLYGHG